MSLTFGDPSLVNVGPGWVTYRAESGTRTVNANECKVIGSIVTVLSSDDRRLVFPVCSLVLHEQDREAKSRDREGGAALVRLAGTGDSDCSDHLRACVAQHV